jgi:hypothetical protein
LFAVLVFVIFSLGGCAASDQYGESLRAPSPAGYAVASREATGGLEHVELVPSGQSSSGWSEMVTTEVLKGGVEEGDPVRFSEWMTGQWKNQCPDARIGAVDSGERNGYRYAFWRMDCARRASTGKPEVAVTLAIEGTYAFYTVQKTWRGAPAEDEVASWKRSYFDTVSVCDSRAEAAHPCSATTAR